MELAELSTNCLTVLYVLVVGSFVIRVMVRVPFLTEKVRYTRAPLKFSTALALVPLALKSMPLKYWLLSIFSNKSSVSFQLLLLVFLSVLLNPFASTASTVAANKSSSFMVGKARPCGGVMSV